MTFWLGFLAGCATTGAFATLLWFVVDLGYTRDRRGALRALRALRALPPATARQLKRAARANRAELQLEHDKRQWIPTERTNFDTEDTQ